MPVDFGRNGNSFGGNRMTKGIIDKLVNSDEPSVRFKVLIR